MPTKSKEVLPAQPLNRMRLLEAIRDQLKTADGRGGISAIINNKEALDPMGDILEDKSLQEVIFKYVLDGDERAIVRRFFANLDE